MRDVEVLPHGWRGRLQVHAAACRLQYAWPRYRDGRGALKAWYWQNWGVSGTDPGERCGRKCRPAHRTSVHRLRPCREGRLLGDPTLDDSNARREVDINKRKVIVKDAQRYMAKKMYNLRFPPGRWFPGCRGRAKERVPGWPD